MPRDILIEFRRDTAANWTATNPTLAAGEPGWESDTDKLKIGDGSTAWNSLPYLSTGAGGGSSPLTTKGDLYTHGASADARLAVGANNTVLVADSTQTDGIKWAQVGEAMIALADVTTDDVSTTKHGFAPKAPNDTKKFLRGDATWAAITRTLNVVITNDGAVLATGVAGDVFLDFPCTITKVTLLADQAGSVVVDIWKAAYGSFPPVIGGSIVASDPPTLSTATKSQDSTLTGWTTTISAGDVLRFNINSVSTITRLDVALTLSG